MRIGDRLGRALDLRLIGIARLDDLLRQAVGGEQHADRAAACFGKTLLHEIDGGGDEARLVGIAAHGLGRDVELRRGGDSFHALTDDSVVVVENCG